jgi:hypothetical protein
MGKFDPDAYFGGIDMDLIDDAFSWFDTAKRE